MSKRVEPKKPSALVWVQGIIGVAVVITGVPAIAGVFALGIIPERLLHIAVLVYLLVAGFIVWRLLRTPRVRWQSASLMVLGALIVIMNIYAYAGGRALDLFMSRIQQPNVSYIEYAVITKKDRAVTVDSATTVGLIGTDSLREASSRALTDVTSAQQHDYDNLTTLTENLNDNSVALASIRKANLDILHENYQEFYDSVSVLATYKVRDEQHVISDVDVRKPFVMYISGIDTYGDIDTVGRSDVNILAVVHPSARKMLLVNTPRDYYVTLHGTSGPPDKLTHAGLYGVDTSRQTLGDLYGVDIPYYMRLNFSSLVKMVDVMGDITVQSDYAFKSFTVGKNTLNSKQALEFARERYSFSDGDRQRGRNQQKVIEAIIAKMSEPRNITRYGAILDTLQGSIQTNMDQRAMTTLAKMQLDDMKRWQVELIDVTGAGATRETYSMGAMSLYVMIPDEASVGMAKNKIQLYLHQ